MATTATNEELTGEDKQYGWRFGCDGTMKLQDAIRFIGVSERTVWRLIEEGKLRKRVLRSKVAIICRRSIQSYFDSLPDSQGE